MDDSLRSLLGRIFRLVLLLAVVGILVNDGIQVGTAFSDASKGLNATMSAALDSASKNPTSEEKGQEAAAAAAEAAGCRLEAYEQTFGESMGVKRAQVALAVSTPVGRTVVVAPFIGLVRKTPQEAWYTDPRVTLRQMKLVDVYEGAP